MQIFNRASLGVAAITSSSKVKGFFCTVSAVAVKGHLLVVVRQFEKLRVSISLYSERSEQVIYENLAQLADVSNLLPPC
jgi:hypothetical protein